MYEDKHNILPCVLSIYHDSKRTFPHYFVDHTTLSCQGNDTNNLLYLNDILYSNITSYLSGHY